MKILTSLKKVHLDNSIMEHYKALKLCSSRAVHHEKQLRILATKVLV